MPEYLSLFIDYYDRYIRQRFPEGTKWNVTMHQDRSVSFTIQAPGEKRFMLVFNANDLKGSTLPLEFSAIARKLKEAKHEN